MAYGSIDDNRQLEHHQEGQQDAILCEEDEKKKKLNKPCCVDA